MLTFPWNDLALDAPVGGGIGPGVSPIERPAGCVGDALGLGWYGGCAVA